MAKKKTAKKKTRAKPKAKVAPMPAVTYRRRWGKGISMILIGALVAGIPWLQGVQFDMAVKWVLTVIGIITLLYGVKALGR